MAKKHFFSIEKYYPFQDSVAKLSASWKFFSLDFNASAAWAYSHKEPAVENWKYKQNPNTLKIIVYLLGNRQ